MRLLLDTHTLFWWLSEKSHLSARACDLIKARDSEVLVSIASAWEIAIKVGKGTWPEALPLIANFENECQTENFRVLPIAVDHARMAGLMQHDHRDPFDRLLAAQAIIEGLTLITVDRKLGALGASCAW